MLNNVRTARLSIPHDPFGLVLALETDIASVLLDSTLGNSTLGILITSAITPSLIQQISLPAA